MKDFMIDDRDGRQVVVRLDSAEEVFVALEEHQETELARRPVPDTTLYISKNVRGAFDRVPSAKEFETFVEQRGYSDDEAADIAGVNPRTIRKWKKGERRVPKSAWRLILLGKGVQRILGSTRYSGT